MRGRKRRRGKLKKTKNINIRENKRGQGHNILEQLSTRCLDEGKD
jgi:hypothetical protein